MITFDKLKKYSNRATVFIETGTLTGTTVALANTLGFAQIYSIELSDKWYKHSVTRFAKLPHITIIHGNSGEKLGELLSKINNPCVIWLDAHYSGGDTAKSDLPLYAELEAIGKHHVKNHTVLIDDMRGFGRSNVEAAIMNINPNYKIIYEDGGSNKQVFKDDILVAMVD